MHVGLNDILDIFRQRAVTCQCFSEVFITLFEILKSDTKNLYSKDALKKKADLSVIHRERHVPESCFTDPQRLLAF